MSEWGARKSEHYRPKPLKSSKLAPKSPKSKNSPERVVSETSGAEVGAKVGEWGTLLGEAVAMETSETQATTSAVADWDWPPVWRPEAGTGARGPGRRLGLDGTGS